MELLDNLKNSREKLSLKPQFRILLFIMNFVSGSFEVTSYSFRKTFLIFYFDRYVYLYDKFPNWDFFT